MKRNKTVQKSLLGIFEVVLVVHPKEESQLRGFLNFPIIVFQAMGGGEEHISTDLQEQDQVSGHKNKVLTNQCCCAFGLENVSFP